MGLVTLDRPIKFLLRRQKGRTIQRIEISKKNQALNLTSDDQAINDDTMNVIPATKIVRRPQILSTIQGTTDISVAQKWRLTAIKR